MAVVLCPTVTFHSDALGSSCVYAVGRSMLMTMLDVMLCALEYRKDDIVMPASFGFTITLLSIWNAGTTDELQNWANASIRLVKGHIKNSDVNSTSERICITAVVPACL